MTSAVWLPEDSQLLIRAETLDKHARESGGPLFGYQNDDEVVITRAFGPGPRARHRPWVFEPDRAAVQAAIDAVATDSAGAERYIGSWHSHPLGVARPSPLDRRTARNIADDAEAGCPRPLMLIQATVIRLSGVRPGRLRAYRWDASAHRLQRLEIVAYASPESVAAPEEGSNPGVRAKGGRARANEAAVAPDRNAS
jgi:integrative and conjugative element protein (TIGR02256 family)